MKKLRTTDSKDPSSLKIPYADKHGLKCTPSVIESICKHVRYGCYPAIASQASGIDPRSFYTWIKKGIAGEEPYATFYAKLNIAQADAENALLRSIADQTGKNWIAAAWILERTRPDRYSLKTKTEVSGPDGGAVTFVELQTSLQTKLDRLAAIDVPVEVAV